MLVYNTFGMKKYNDDDGRTIANMDNLDQRSMLSSWFGVLSPSVRDDVFGSNGKKDVSERNTGSRGSFDARNMGSEIQLTREERWALIRYTMKYSLAIGMAFLLGLGLFVFILFKLW